MKIKIYTQEWHPLTRHIITSPHGSIILEMFKQPQWFGGSNWLYSLYVHPAYRHRGEATALIAKAHELVAIRSNGVTHLNIDNVKATPHLLPWYKSLGYTEANVPCPNFWGENAIILTRKPNTSNVL